MAPDFGAAAQVFFFLALTIVQILLSLGALSYAGHSFLTIFVNTAAGADEVIWPQDPYQDWIFKFFYLLWILAAWAVPAALLLRLLDLPLPLYFALLAGLLWLIFPVTLLSSLSASSGLVLLRGLILSLLLRRPGALIRFYLSSGPFLALCVALGYVGVLTHFSFVLVPAAVAGAIGFFVYARLLGRLAWLTSLRKLTGKARTEPSRPEEADRLVTYDPWHVAEAAPPAAAEPVPALVRPRKKPAKKKRPKSPRAYDPWAVPEEPVKFVPFEAPNPDDPLGPATGSYEMKELDEPAPAPNMAQEDLPPDVVGYGVAAPDETARLPEPATPAVTRIEEQLAAPRRPPKLPPRPLLDGVYSFPFYPASGSPLAIVALGLLGMLFLLRMQIAYFPTIWK